MTDVRTVDAATQRAWLGVPEPVQARPRSGQRMYASARNSRGSLGGVWNSSADAELSSSLTALRTRSRALVRDAAFAKRARVVIQNNVVGTGIGLQAQVKTTRGELADRINGAIEREHADWCRATNCHTGGTLHFSDMERFVMGQVFEAGECLIRKHPFASGESRVPLTLEVIEAERLADEFTAPQAASPNADVRMGVELDAFMRPAAYWIRERHPGDIRFPGSNYGAYSQRFIRVPADQIIHLRIVDRWPQTRGEPWLHGVARKLNDMDGYSEAEIVAARGAASYMGFIETPDLENTVLGEPQADGTEDLELAPGMIPKLGAGEKFAPYAPNRPNSALDPFMRYMLREVAAGLSISYESLSKDYSQSNYSSSRLSLIDDRDVWRSLQQWFIRSLREPLHREWLQAAVLAGAIPEIPIGAYAVDADKFRAVTFKPRGWSWIDPTKEVQAYREAVRSGFTTVGAVVSATGDGRDLEDVLTERRAELDFMASKQLIFDTDPIVAAPSPVAKVDPVADAATAETQPGQGATPPARIVNLRK